MDSVLVDSVLVIPGPFQNPPEFCGTEITILAGSTAKIPFCRIPGIDWIPADSGRNTWRTVKNSGTWKSQVVQLAVHECGQILLDGMYKDVVVWNEMHNHCPMFRLSEIINDITCVRA